MFHAGAQQSSVESQFKELVSYYCNISKSLASSSIFAERVSKESLG